MTQKNIIVPKTARYFVIGEVSEKINQLWIVCHGYGELAPYFIKKFESLQNESTLIVAPEALNRFYREGFSGKVGASWMTREERTSEIQDYVNYLEMVYNEVLSTLPDKNITINILGFSQATATVCRWVSHRKSKIHNLILWAGFFPHDININQDVDYFNSINCYIVMGNNDPFYNETIINESLEKIRQQNIHFKYIAFEGNHQIHAETLQTIASQINFKEK